MSEREDAGQKDVEDDHYHQHQQQPQSYPELSDDNPIENDVEHTTTDDVAAEGQKSASADSGAEEVGSPEQQATHGTGICLNASIPTFLLAPCYPPPPLVFTSLALIFMSVHARFIFQLQQSGILSLLLFVRLKP